MLYRLSNRSISKLLDGGEADGSFHELYLLDSLLANLLLKLIVDLNVFTADEENFGLSSSNCQMRKLRQIMFEDNGLDKFRRDLLSSICLIEEYHHFLVLVVDLKAIIELLDMEDSTFTLTLSLVLTNCYKGW